MKRNLIVSTISVLFCSISLSFAQFGGGSYQWNNTGTPPQGITHSTYHSYLMNVDIGYNVYLPPNYNSSTDRYPVVYSLNAMGGNEGSNCSNYSGVLKDGITGNQFPPIIVIFVNGRGNTFYSDSKDGKIKCESSIINELIPHVDSTYRTKADRTQRAVEGVSMGGFGSLLLGFKHPDLFASIGTYDAALVNWDTLSEQTFDRSIPESIFGNDGQYFNEHSYPFTFLRNNASTIKSLGIKVRMYDGDNDKSMGPLYSYNCAMRDSIKKYDISVEFNTTPGGTHGQSFSATNIKANLIFHTTNFEAASKVLKQFAPVQSIAAAHSGSFTFSTMSSVRIPVQKHQSVSLYDLNGRNLGQIPTGGLNYIDCKAVQEKFGSGIYILKP